MYAKRLLRWTRLLLWWRTDEGELQRQVGEYDTLKFSKSARGTAAILLVISALVSIPRSLASDWFDLIDIGVVVVLAWLISRGHAWAMIVAMIFWTFSRLMAAIEIATPAAAVLTYLFWAIYMYVFLLAFRVERTRQALRGERLSEQSVTNP